MILGPPGSGKTTVSDHLGSRPSVRSVVTGRLLRREASRDDSRGEIVRESLDQGELVPTETVLSTLVRELAAVEEPALVFDGFPRSPEQLDSFFEMMEKVRCRFAGVVVLDLASGEADRRLAGRGRADDEEATTEERREVYNRKTVPLIEELQTGFPAHVVHVSAEPAIEDVVRSVAEVLRNQGIDVSAHAVGREEGAERRKERPD